jgi:hypothetical protein
MGKVAVTPARATVGGTPGCAQGRRNFHFLVVFIRAKCYDMRMISNMKWTGLVCGVILLGGRGLCAAVPASGPTAVPAPAGDAEAVNPYLVIVERNAFRLNPPPPPPAPPSKEADLPTVKYSGIVVNRGHTNALFAVSYKPSAKPSKDAPETKYLRLSEGEKDPCLVELVKIMRGGEEVEILNSGTRMVLNQKDNGFDKPATPGGGGPPGMRTLAPGVPNTPVGIHGAVPGPVGAQAAEVSGGGVISSSGQGGLITGGSGSGPYRGGISAGGGGGGGGIISAGGISSSGNNAAPVTGVSFAGSPQTSYADTRSGVLTAGGAASGNTPVTGAVNNSSTSVVNNGPMPPMPPLPPVPGGERQRNQ